MNATMVANGTKAVPPVVSSIQDIPLGKIRESKTNPRRFFDEAKLAEFAEFCSSEQNPRYVAFGLESFPLGDWRLQTFALP